MAKETADGIEVSSRSYYYLLDWNENDEWRYINNTFNKNRLNQLTIKEYNILFEHAINNELEALKNKLKNIP